MNGRGQVVDQQGFGAFGVCPVTLPENMTVNSTGSIDTAGEHRPGSSTGCTPTRASPRWTSSAIRWAPVLTGGDPVLATTNAPIKVRSLTTIGTPWQGSCSPTTPMTFISKAECQG